MFSSPRIFEIREIELYGREAIWSARQHADGDQSVSLQDAFQNQSRPRRMHRANDASAAPSIDRYDDQQLPPAARTRRTSANYWSLRSASGEICRQPLGRM